MGDELETREKLLESAMAEFSENGYMKASLRKICADAFLQMHVSDVRRSSGKDRANHS